MPVFERFLQKIFLLVVGLTCTVFVQATIRYVRPMATGSGNGSSWFNASNDLQAMINASNGSDEVWVASGTYKPNRQATDVNIIVANSRLNAFVLKVGVKIYGGFAGIESTLSQRNFTNNVTILSGDIGQANNNADNSFHVVMSVGPAGTAVLDGFTITRGCDLDPLGGPYPHTYMVNGYEVFSGLAAGMYIESSSPSVNNCIFTDNPGGGAGGGMYTHFSSSTISNCTFSNNTSRAGGAMYNHLSPLTITECTFSKNIINVNTAQDYGGGGGALYNNNCSPVITGCTFSQNRISATVTLDRCEGGAMFNKEASPVVRNCTFSNNSNLRSAGGGISNYASSLPRFTDCIFTGNKAAASGGAMVNRNSSSSFLTNCTFTANKAEKGGAISNYSSSPVINNCGFFEDTALNSGGAIYNYYSSSPGITGCSFTGNVSSSETTDNPFAVKGGGAILNETSSSPVITDCIFFGNRANNDPQASAHSCGGAILNVSSSSPDITRCNFLNNVTGGDGGGLYNSESSPNVNNCIFSGNNAAIGGGIGNNKSSAAFVRCTIEGNYAGYGGGGSYNFESLPSFTNCAFTGNKAAQEGGGMFNDQSSPVINNCTFGSNRADEYGGAIFNQSSSAVIRNSIIWGNISLVNLGPAIYGSTSSVIYSIVQGGYSGGVSVINADPLFLNPVQASSAPTSSGNYQIKPCSPAINTGSNSAVPAGTTTDLAGGTRIVGGTVDMGAYEFPGLPVSIYSSLATPSANGIVYVKNTGNGNGSSWTNALASLADALLAANYNTDIEQIWVAGGTYYPAYDIASPSCFPADNRDKSFVMVNNVKVYGGFGGTETSVSQRNWEVNKTVLSGNAGMDTVPANNSYHVIVSAGDVGTAVLDGFTIKDGRANGSGNVTVNLNSITRSIGGGMYIFNSSPAVNNCIIQNNSAGGNGGGIFAVSSNTFFTNSLVSGNASAANGGGMYAISGNTGLQLINCTVSANKAVNGGGVYAGVEREGIIAKIYNSIIYGNKSNDGVTVNDIASPVLTTDDPELYYSITATAPSPGVYTSVSNNSQENPLFIAGANASIAPTAQGNYRMQKCSPAINSGRNLYVPAGITKDLNGTTRIFNTNVDKGAYEYNVLSLAPDANGILYVDYTKNGDGSSWENAVPELSEALKEANGNTAIKQIWVAKGTYYPAYDAALACNPADSRDKTFVLVNNVKVYGGFTGTEIAAGQRNWAANETVLSGDIGLAGTATDNCYHIVVSSGAAGTAELDGFSIRDANANGAGTLNINGNSLTRGAGGGMYIINSSPVIRNCNISNNSANIGAGILSGATTGGGNSSFINCIISGNHSDSQGGGIFSSHSNSGATCVKFYNCTVTGNSASSGAGGYFATLGTEPPKIYNSIFYGNKTNAGAANNDIGSASSVNDDPEVYYSVVGNGAASGVYTNMGGLIVSNPLFIHPLDAASSPVAGGNYRLQVCSPAINTGEFLFLAPGTTKDLDYHERIISQNLDRGAYEKALALPDTNGIVYVDSSNADNQADGSSWDKAVPDLADALKAAKADTSIKEIWVAKGTYYPLYNVIDDSATISCPAYTSRDNTFILVKNVKVYGGFAGRETAATERDILLNKTILSANPTYTILRPALSGKNVALDNDNSNNFYHVVVSAGPVGTAALDGFTVTGGNADNNSSFTLNLQSIERNRGGGMVNILSSPAILNCTFLQNAAAGSGGGIANYSSYPIIADCSMLNNIANTGAGMDNYSNSNPSVSGCNFSGNIAAANGGGMANGENAGPSITNCTFTANTAVNYGGGMYNASAAPSINGCIFSGNNADSQGGGMYNSANSPTVINSEFKNNSATNYGGGMANVLSSSPAIKACIFAGNSADSQGGGMYNSASSPAVTNCAFTGNSAINFGGGIANISSSPVVKNVTIAGNKSGSQGGGVYNNAASSPVIGNCIIWGNASATGSAIYPAAGLTGVTYSLIEDGYAGGNNILNADPLFVMPLAPAVAPADSGNYKLEPCSPAVNAGSNVLIPAGVTTDLGNNPRIAFATVDMGAYEFQSVKQSTGTWRGINTNWNDAVNWCGRIIPDSATNVVIPPGLGNYPVTDLANAVKDIEFGSGSSLEITTTGKFTINGAYTNNGASINNNGIWIMAGLAALQTFPGTAATILKMKILEITNANGITLDKSFEAGELRVKAGQNTVAEDVHIHIRPQ